MIVHYCGNCGLEIKVIARFCDRCGADLTTQHAFPARPETGPPAQMPTRGAVTFSAMTTWATATGRRPPASVMAPPGGRRPNRARRRARALGLLQALAAKRKEWGLHMLTKPSWEQGAPPAKSANLTLAGAPGAATALAQASGLSSRSPSSSTLYGVLAVIAVLLAGAVSIVYRDGSLLSFRVARSEFNLTGPEEKSEQFVRLAGDRFQAGDYLGAVEGFNQALGLRQDNLLALAGLAQAYAQLGRTEEEIETRHRLLRLSPENLGARLRLAEVYLARGAGREAEQEYRQLIAIGREGPEVEAAMRALETFALAAAAATPEVAGRRVPHRSPRPAEPVYLPNGSSPIPALVQTPEGSLLSWQPRSWSGHQQQADDQVMRRALAQGRKQKGAELNNHGRHHAAIKEFKAALDLTPEDKDLYYLLGSAYFGSGQPTLAYEAYRQCDEGIYVAIARDAAKKAEKAAREVAKPKRVKS